MEPPADARLRWLLDEADLTDEALLNEALTLLRGHHAMKESRADVLHWVHEARAGIMTLPDGSARAAFLALCDFVEKRPAESAETCDLSAVSGAITPETADKGGSLFHVFSVGHTGGLANM